MEVDELQSQTYSILKGNRYKIIPKEISKYTKGKSISCFVYLKTRCLICSHRVYQQAVLGTYSLECQQPCKIGESNSDATEIDWITEKEKQRKKMYLLKKQDHLWLAILQAQSHLGYKLRDDYTQKNWKKKKSKNGSYLVWSPVLL